MSIPRQTAHLIVKRRFLILLPIVLATGFFGYQLRLFQVHHNEREQLARDDPEMVRLEEFRRDFGETEMMVIALQAEDIFAAPVLRHLAVLTEAFERLDGVSHVVSLANIEELSADAGGIEGRRFLAEIPESPGALMAKRSAALSNRQWVGDLVSKDGTVAAINVFVGMLAENTGDRLALVAGARDVIAKHTASGIEVHLTGISPLISDCLDCVRQDVRRFLWLTPVVMVGLLFMFFRSARAVVIPMFVIAACMTWSLGVFFTAGKAVDGATAMMPTLIALICLSDVIHILGHYFENAARCRDRRKVIVMTMEHMLGACFMTSLTTAIGFGALSVSHVRSIREFGLWTAIGIMQAYCLVVTLTPIMLSFFPLPGPAARRRFDHSGTTRALERVSRLVTHRAGAIVAGALVLLAASILGITRLETEAQLSTRLPRTAPSVRGLHLLAERMAGFQSLEITLSGDPGVFRRAWAVREIHELAQFLETVPRVAKVFSLAGVIQHMHGLLAEEQHGGRAFPRSDIDIAEYLLLMSLSDHAEFLNVLVTPDFSRARISVRAVSSNSAQCLQLLERVEEASRRLVDGRLEAETTGMVKLFATQVEALVDSQLRSLVFSLTIITLVLVLYLRSVKGGLLCVPPNVGPVLVTLGAMGLIGISLNVSTVMISCIAIGLAVDNTIHYLASFRREMAATGSEERAADCALRGTGRAMVFTSAVVAGGFAIFMFSRFVPTRCFGFLTGVTMVTALAADLVLLPVLIRVFKLR